MAKKTRAKQDRGTAQNPASEHHGDDLTASLHARSPSPIPIPAPLGRNSREFEEDTENLDVFDRQIDSQFPSASGLPNSPTQSRTPSSYIGKANLRYSTSSSAQYVAHDRRSYGQTSVTGQPVQREVSLQGQRQTYVDDDSIYWAQADNRSQRYGDEGSWPSPNNPPIPVPAPGITGEAQPHNRVRFAESSAPTQLMSPQVASAQSALSSSHPSPNFLNEPKRLRVNIPPTASGVPPSANASWSPDTGMYAAGWKSWAAEAQKLPKSMQTPLGNRNRMPLPSHTYQYAQGPPSHPVSHTMSRAQNSSGASRVTMDATAPGQMGWTDLRANNSWGSALRRGGGGDQWEDMEDEEYDEDYDEDGQHTHVHGSNTMGIARSNAVIPLAPSTSHPRRAVDAGGTAIEPAQRALFGHDRDSKDRLHWDFDPNKDPRVHSALEAVSYLAYDCVQMGIRHFLQGQQRGALFCNVSLNIEERQELPLDWLSLPDIEKTRDVILYRCTAYNDPMHEVLVFVFLMSRTGNSIAIWRKRVTIPEELLQQHAYALAALKQATHPTPPMTAPTTTVETEPESVVTQPSRSSKLGKKRKEKDPNKPKRKKWWQFWKKKAKTPK